MDENYTDSEQGQWERECEEREQYEQETRFESWKRWEEDLCVDEFDRAAQAAKSWAAKQNAVLVGLKRLSDNSWEVRGLSELVSQSGATIRSWPTTNIGKFLEPDPEE